MWPAGGEARADESTLSAPQEDSSSGADGGGYSTTNVQEVGVDEPDIVKTDGEILVSVANSALQVFSVADGTPAKVGTLPLGEADQYVDATLLLDGDRAMVFVRDNSVIAYDSVAESAPAPADVREIAPMVPTTPVTKILLVDLSEPSRPTVTDTLEVDGSNIDARLVDGTVRVVVSSQPTLAFPMGEDDWNADEDDLIARNKATIAESEIDDWLPSYRLTSGDDESAGRLVDCENLHHPQDFAGFSTVSVLTLGFDELTAGSASGVLTSGDTVYASTDRLYVATFAAQWAIPFGDTAIVPRDDTKVATGIHAFDITGGEPARYVASGEVEGRVIGRYAFSEHEGVLRVATTTEDWSPNAAASESQLITLTERGAELVELGRVGGLGKTEQIYAVRYFGDTAYVVTFRQTDPLYTIDLSDPAKPTVTGELKITGYSAYLHDVGDGRLVGVGQEADPDGRIVGAQISLFDVSDPAAATKLDGHVVRDGWTEAEWDPHAFLFWPDTRDLVVPMASSTSQGALVLEVTDDAVTERGTVTRAGETQSPEYWVGTPMRSLVVGETLLTLWSDGLQANALGDLGLRGWAPYDEA